MKIMYDVLNNFSLTKNKKDFKIEFLIVAEFLFLALILN